jgi:hypothetical protein
MGWLNGWITRWEYGRPSSPAAKKKQKNHKSAHRISAGKDIVQIRLGSPNITQYHSKYVATLSTALGKLRFSAGRA